MYVGSSFQVMEPNESEVFSLNFVNDLPRGDAITGIPVFRLSVRDGYGADPDPMSHLDGTAGASGATAMQRVSGLLPDVTYIIQATVQTVLGNTMSLWSYIPTQRPS